MKMKKDEKWFLSTWKCVEDELFVFGSQCSENHPAHSFILDTSDAIYLKYDVFSSDELSEIKAHREKTLPSMPVPLRSYINSFNKANANDIRQQSWTPQPFDQDYDHNESHDFDWVRFTVYSLFREYESVSLKKLHNEEWYMSHVWHFIDTVFNDADDIDVLR